MRIGVVLLVLVVSGCVTLQNSYTTLNREHEKLVVQYTPGSVAKADSFLRHEIDASIIKAEMQRGKYYVVLNWVPHCRSSNCRTLAYYNSLYKQLDSLDVKMYLVAALYDIPEIRQQYNKFGYDGKLYVIDKDTYGKHKMWATKYFVGDLAERKLTNRDSLGWASFILFRNKEIVDYGMDRERIFAHLR